MRDWRKWHPAPGIGPGEEGSIPLFLNFIGRHSLTVKTRACHARNGVLTTPGVAISKTSVQTRHRQQLAVSLKGKNILEGMDSINPYNWQSKFSTYKEIIFRIKMILLRYPTGPQILLRYFSWQRTRLVSELSPVRFWLGALYGQIYRKWQRGRL